LRSGQPTRIRRRLAARWCRHKVAFPQRVPLVDEVKREQERHRDRGARGELGEVAERRLVRFPGQVHAHAGGGHHRRPRGVEPRLCDLRLPGRAFLEVDRDEAQPFGNAVAEVDEALPLPCLRARLVHLEHHQPRREVLAALSERVEAGPEQHVLPGPAPGTLGDQVLDEPGARHDSGAEPAGEYRVHVRPVLPAVLWRRQPQADLIL